VDSQDLLQLAESLARVAHDGQQRKGNGEPYFNHCQRVAYAVAQYGTRAKIIAYLHDLIEDTDVDSWTLLRMFPPSIVQVVQHLTRLESETYRQYLTRIVQSESKLALVVKLADVEDNLADDGWAGAPRMRYELALRMLRQALYEEADS
jgi:(p)ppGpp synthase/HD superfamily hydrolase